jgi:hypothetical protein
MSIDLSAENLLSQYRESKDIEIERLLSQYGTSLKETRAMYPQLIKAVQQRQLTTALPTQPLFFTASEAQDMGLALQEGWMIKMTPNETGGYSTSLVTPQKWEITDNYYISPTGERYTQADMQALFSAPTGDLTIPTTIQSPTVEDLTDQGKQLYQEYQQGGGTLDVAGWLNLKEQQQLETEQVFGKVFPQQSIDEVLEYINTNPEGFLADIRAIGRTPDTEALLKTLSPDITEEQISQIFGTTEAMPVGTTDQVTATLAEVPLWKQIISAIFPPARLLFKETRNELLAGLSVLGSYWAKYVDRPWQFYILGSKLFYEELLNRPNEDTLTTIEQMNAVYQKYGWASIFSDEFYNIYEGYKAKVSVGEQFKRMEMPIEISEWLNPVYIIPIGDVAGGIAKAVSKIPVIGEVAMRTAAGAQAVERGLAAPIELGVKGVQKAGMAISENLAKKLIGGSEHLVTLMDLPTSEVILQATLADNWMKRALQTAAKIPPVKAILEKSLGWRIIAEREVGTVEDLVAHGAILKVEFTRMGRQAVFPVISELRAIASDPVKLFGFNEKATSAMMIERLLPEYKGLVEAGTLEHVFTHPEMYSWANLDRGLQYVTKFHELNTEILNMLKKEGIAPENVLDEWWMHRVVEGKVTPAGDIIGVTGRPGIGAKSIGAKASYEKHRAYKTMAEGIADGIKYNINPETSIATYLQEAFKQIGDERFIQYVGEGLQALGKEGITPSDRLLRLFPELFEEIPTAEGRALARKAVLRTDELADVNHFNDVINRAMRGEKLPEGTLKAIERRFPELGAKFRAIVTGEPMNILDEAAHLAETGPKELFSYPQQQAIKAISQVEWDAMNIADRVALVKNLGLEGKLGSKAWDALSLEERGLLATGKAVRPQIEGIKELTGEASFKEVKLELPIVDKKAELNSLKGELKAMTEARKGAYWEARQAQSFAMERARQPGLGEGFIMQPFAGGKMYDREFIDAFNKFFGREPGLPGLNVVGDVAGILRITKAALDLSAMAIQGMPSWGLAHAYMLTNPKTGLKLMGSWYKALGYSIRAYFDPDAIFRLMEKNSDSIMQRIAFGGGTIGTDYLRLEAQSGLGKLFNKLPFYQRAELSFSTATEVVRDEFWKILTPKAMEQGKEFELARFLDRMTGISDSRALGVPIIIKQLETSFIWFAPNYTRACLSVLADIFRGGYTGDAARKAIGGMIGAGAMMYAGIQYGLSTLEGKSHEQAWDSVMEGFGIVTDPITGETTWKPSAQFMSIKIGNYNFGIGGFWYGLVRLAGNILACVNEVGGKERIDLIRIFKNGSFNKDNPFVYWWYSRASPLVGTGFELASGRDFLGYPIETPMEYLKYIATRFEPIWMEQGINWMIPSLARDYEIPEGMAREAVAVAELFGLRTFPESAWTQFYDKAAELLNNIPRDVFAKYLTQDELTKILDAQAKGKLQWGNLPSVVQIQLLAMYPELQSLYSAAQADSALRDSGVWAAWTQRQDEEQKIYYDRGNELIGQVRSGELTTTDLRTKWSDAGQNYGTMLDALEKDPHYQEIYDYFAAQAAKGNKYNWNIDLALADYQQVMFADYTDDKGDYDFSAKDKAVNDYIDRWGQETYNIIREMYADKKLQAGLDPALVRLADDKDALSRAYWQLPYKPIYQLDEADVPAQYYALWKQYQTVPETQKEGFLALHPELTKDWRAEWRLAHPEDDARLALWGYGGKLQSQAAYDLVVKWANELNIPLDQMGLGLPPQNLIADYFDYNKLSTEFSGNSAQAKLWKLEHSDFTNWAMENWNWTGTEDYRGMEYYQLQIQWADKEKQYDAVTGDTAKQQFLQANPDYWSARLTIRAMDYEVPEDYVPLYVQYYQMSTAGYDQERFLMEHKDYYKDVWLGILGNQPKDFSKIPTVKEEKLLNYYDSLATGTPRLQARCKDAELDAALVRIRGLTPAYGTSRCG